MFDAIVLAGGEAIRLHGADKPGLDMAGVTLLDRVVAAVADAAHIVVVGPERPLAPTSPAVMWCREEPAGGGPVAAIATGLAHVDADIVVTLAADLPSIEPAISELFAGLEDGTSDCAALVDADGRVNYLAAAWHRASLQRAMATLAQPRGASMRTLMSVVSLAKVPDKQGWGLDCDTWADVDEARRRLDRGWTI